MKFDFESIIKNPALLISNTLLPLILIGLLGFVTKSNYGNQGMSSFDYYGVTMMVLSALLVVMTATNVFMEERVKQPNTRMIYTPIPKYYIYGSKILSTSIVGFICLDSITILGQYIFQINFGGAFLIYFLILLNALVFFSSCFGVMLCCLLKTEEKASSIGQLPIIFSVVLGGVFFNIYGLGRIMSTISNLSPVKWILESSFRVIYDHNLNMVFPVTLSILFVAVLCVLVCQKTFRTEEYTC
jgi:ABC-2 type transport system permease protein